MNILKGILSMSMKNKFSNVVMAAFISLQSSYALASNCLNHGISPDFLTEGVGRSYKIDFMRTEKFIEAALKGKGGMTFQEKVLSQYQLTDKTGKHTARRLQTALNSLNSLLKTKDGALEFTKASFATDADIKALATDAASKYPVGYADFPYETGKDKASEFKRILDIRIKEIK